MTLALILAACASPVTYPLPSRDPAINACAGVNTPSLVLHGSLSSGVARVWASDVAGRESAVYWPPGYAARFDPGLVVLDAGGAARTGEGDDLIAIAASRGLSVCHSAGITSVREEGPATGPSGSPSG
jgi:hypothetical protein